ncbi:hypothetical protein GGE43_004417 [Agrobacterium tumefaciens]|jgi:hypothetical protein|uniref:Uncharacterized protein n=2 Tax=Agrobacterium tumefaciens complex TaxID=1183400 RepID=A0AAW8LX76_AGRTU|nr:hypothetical protein [Agrobacterium radiobacter]MBP2535938.1 hypothetical protein [Agrobacterium tumefaciens]MCP2135977.1 hypothetical protein [Rhizobium sp. SLBN-94]MBB4321104.1 hypothetical protein [Agrobacterium radiobacter]MBB4325464.1 hypothetical protein [Agrobacterium radiobacter]
MDFHPITKPQCLVIRGTHIHAAFHHSLGPFVVNT